MNKQMIELKNKGINMLKAVLVTFSQAGLLKRQYALTSIKTN